MKKLIIIATLAFIGNFSNAQCITYTGIVQGNPIIRMCGTKETIWEVFIQVKITGDTTINGLKANTNLKCHFPSNLSDSTKLGLLQDSIAAFVNKKYQYKIR